MLKVEEEQHVAQRGYFLAGVFGETEQIERVVEVATQFGCEDQLDERVLPMNILEAFWKHLQVNVELLRQLELSCSDSSS